MKPDHIASHQYQLTMILLLTISEELKVTKPMREAAGEAEIQPRACCTVDTAVKTSTPHFRCSRVGARWSTDVLPCIPWSIGTCSTQRLFGERAPNEEKKREKITGRQERSISALFVDANAIYRSGIISTRS